MNLETIVAFSPLRWNGSVHRMQHILSRLAVKRRVIYIEEPVSAAASAPHWQLSSPAPNVLVCRPHLPGPGPAYGPEQLPAWQPLLRKLRESYIINDLVAWVSTPLAAPLLNELGPDVIIYDCIDEISSPRACTAQWNDSETKLLSRADVVFTSGLSLYRAIRSRHANVHYFPSSVDAAHFRQARGTHQRLLNHPLFSRPGEPEVQAELPHPRLGFYGVLDQRVDFALIDAVARTRPDWQLVLIGPVESNPRSLPRQPNLHYLGPRPYNQLPGYFSGWDVALLPFVVNETTRYLNPATALEYMAAERLIVSTRIADVVEPYCDIVYVGHSPNTFIVGCEQALNASPAERAERLRLMREVLMDTSWQHTARAMEHVMMDLLAARRATSIFKFPARVPGKWSPVTSLT